jgi:threonyl-tRNA synthetase
LLVSPEHIGREKKPTKCFKEFTDSRSVQKKELDDFLILQEEAKKRDHRKLGEALELFTINDTVGAGLPIWLPKGATLRMTIREYLVKRLGEAVYQMLETPHIAQSILWKTSGHSDFYKDSMYSPFKADEQEFLVKPMNCLFIFTLIRIE